MSETLLRLPEEQLLEFSKSVEVVSTKILEGLHPTERGGRGVEFQNALPFTAGEDPRFIDWKRYASTDRMYVNRFQREERTGWRIWVDPSKSMSYRGKANRARLWAGSLIFLARAWGDPWWLAPDFSHSIEEAFSYLATEKSSDESRGSQLADLANGASNTDRLILISDFFIDTAELKTQIRRLEELYYSVHLIQILSPEERDFGFTELTEFLDLESSSKLILDAKSVKKAYLGAYQKLDAELKSLVSDRISFMLCMYGDSLEQQLISFFESL